MISRQSLIIFMLALVVLHAERPRFLSYNPQVQAKGLGRFFWYNSNYVWPFGPFYLPELITTSTYTSTKLETTTFTNYVDAYCIASATEVCPVRRRRAILEDDLIVYLQGQPIRPSQVSRMMMTALPLIDRPVVVPDDMLSPSIESDEEKIQRQSRKQKGQWYYATTTTVTLTAVTIVNSTLPDLLPITVSGCIPNCLTSLALCP